VDELYVRQKMKSSNSEIVHNEALGEDVYASPKTDVVMHLSCPKCGKEMEEGHLRSSSSILWAGDVQSKLKKMFFGGEPIAKPKTGIGCRHNATYCKECKLFILQD
jgi:hypothetical protein